MISNMKILVLAPHTDDGELGCGATIARLLEEGNQVYYAAFSACKQSVMPEFPEDILISEVKSATKILGIGRNFLKLYNYEVRKMNYHRQEILDDLIQLRTEIKPDVVFMPSRNDIHQDHLTIAEEGLRAFKFSTIFCYEIPWNNLTFHTTAFFKLENRHLEKKLAALAEYKSQAHRPYVSADYIRSLARTRGIQSGTDLAEVFELIRWIS